MSDILHSLADEIENGGLMDIGNSTFGNLFLYMTTIVKDEVTVLQSPVVGHPYLPAYEYMILETRDSFRSGESDPTKAFWEWTQKCIDAQRGPNPRLLFNH